MAGVKECFILSTEYRSKHEKEREKKKNIKKKNRKN